MRENRVKSALKAGQTVIGVGLTIAANPNVVRVMANAGYDFLFIDLEHTLISPENLTVLVQMARACGISPIARVQDTEYHLIANILDSGADGVIVPRVETRTQAERIIAASKFPPLGVRGCGTSAPLDYRPEPWQQALPWLNEQSLVAVQVESTQSIENLPDILQVAGVDLVVIGPMDLSISLGVPGEFTHPKLVEAMERVLAIGQAHQVPVGTVMGNPEILKPWWEKGMRFFSCGSDVGFLMSGAARDVQAMRAYGK
jgi:2-dehydro-3-deoxyglucarate aldolase/4-hydroxy-2-oxoheptanedioate aldolase